MRAATRLPPSPQSRHAKKPNITIEGLLAYSLDRLAKDKPANRSTRSVEKPIIKESTNFNSNITNNMTKKNNTNTQNYSTVSSMSHKQNEEPIQCVNHADRKAMGMGCKVRPQYYCFECCLFEARKGTKIVHLQEQTATHSNLREKEIKLYIKESNELEQSLTDQLQALREFAKGHTGKFQMIMQDEIKATKMLIQEIEARTEKQVQFIHQLSTDHCAKLEELCQQLMSVKSLIRLNRLDVIKNYEDCLNGFDDSQYKLIMKEYWGQIMENRESMAKHSTYDSMAEFQAKLQEIQGMLQGNNSREFTFSKPNRYETPRSGSKLQGVPIIYSQYLSRKEWRDLSLKSDQRDERQTNESRKRDQAAGSISKMYAQI